MNNANLSHLDDRGQAHMVDVSTKPVTTRTAIASARVKTRPDVLDAILNGNLPKGEALAVARVAGISAAKRTADLIPLCHPLPLEWAEITFERVAPDLLGIRATVRTCARTGVEMEALTAAAVAALTVYDMAKAVDQFIEIAQIQLEEKQGGQRGDFTRSG